MQFFRKTEFLIVLISIAATFAWMLLARYYFFAGKPFFSPSEILTVIEYKGSVFIAGLTLITFLMVKSCKKQIHKATEKFTKSEGIIKHKEHEMIMVLDSITDGFFIVDNRFNILRANKLFTSLLENPANEVEGQNLFSLLPTLEFSVYYNEFNEALNKQTPIHFEGFHACNGCWYSISAYPYGTGLSVFFKDVSRVKQAELQIVQSQHNLSALINNTEDFIWSVDKDGRYLIFNEVFEQFYFLQTGERLSSGKRFLNQSMFPIEFQKLEAMYDQALNGEKFSAELEFNVNDNAPQHYCVAFHPIHDKDEVVTGVGCFMQNITGEKLHRKKIEEQNKKLKEIAFITSHTLRAPATNIQGLAQLLDSKNPMSDTNIKSIKLIRLSADELDRKMEKIVQLTETEKAIDEEDEYYMSLYKRVI